MLQPPGFINCGEEKLVCELDNIIYGLPDSGRCWNEEFDARLKQADMKQMKTDPYVYKWTDGKDEIYILIYCR